MRPHAEDQMHNIRVGRAMREIVHQAQYEGLDPTGVDERIGHQINTIAKHSYDLGAREAVQPRTN